MSVSRSGRSGISVNQTPKKSRSLTDASGLPGPPTNFSATAYSAAIATMTWAAPIISGDSSVTSYTVSNSPAHGSVNISGTSASVTGLTASTQYSLNVRAVNSLGSGIISGNLTVTTSAFNSAIGGTETTVSNYNGTGETWKVHAFTTTGTLNVTGAPNPFRILTVGGGGGGGSGYQYPDTGSSGGGGGGAGQVVVTASATLSVAAYSVSVPGAGAATSVGGLFTANAGGGGNSATPGGGPPPAAAWGGTSGNGFAGGSTGSNPGHRGGGGGGGASAVGGAADFGGGGGGAGLVSNVTGSNVTYGIGGNGGSAAGGSNGARGASGVGFGGGGGGGGTSQGTSPNAAVGGYAAIAYRIA